MDPKCLRTCASVWREKRERVKVKVATLEGHSIIDLKVAERKLENPNLS